MSTEDGRGGIISVQGQCPRCGEDIGPLVMSPVRGDGGSHSFSVPLPQLPDECPHCGFAMAEDI